MDIRGDESMNNIVLIGRLTRDPDLRYTSNGKAVATFGIAVNRPFSKTKEADFFNVVVWGKSAENCANYTAKGRLVGIHGRLQSRSYETTSGEKRQVTEVVADQVEFLEWGGQKSDAPNNGNNEVDWSDFEALADDEDLPF